MCFVGGELVKTVQKREHLTRIRATRRLETFSLRGFVENKSQSDTATSATICCHHLLSASNQTTHGQTACYVNYGESPWTISIRDICRTDWQPGRLTGLTKQVRQLAFKVMEIRRDRQLISSQKGQKTKPRIKEHGNIDAASGWDGTGLVATCCLVVWLAWCLVVLIYLDGCVANVSSG